MKKLVMIVSVLISLSAVAGEPGYNAAPRRSTSGEKNLRKMMNALPAGTYQGEDSYDGDDGDVCYLTVEHENVDGKPLLVVTLASITGHKRAHDLTFYYGVNDTLEYNTDKYDNTVEHSLSSSKVIQEETEDQYEVDHLEITEVEFENGELISAKLNEVESDWQSDPSENIMMCSKLQKIK